MTNSSMMKLPALLISIIIINAWIEQCTTKPIFIDYSSWGSEASTLFKYYFDIDNGTYVDIGSFDPIQISNTLNLYTMGWSGINIQANIDRLKSFWILRPTDINLHSAVGESDKYVTLYQTQSGADSTISEKVKDYFKDEKNTTIVKQIMVPSITLGQLCQRYYQSKPTFINLDIEGYQGRVLEGNSWDNQLCRPELIVTQYVNASEKSGLSLPKDVLSKHNYTLVQPKVGNNEVFVANQVRERYKQKLEQGSRMLKQMQIIKFPQIRKSIQKNLSVSEEYLYNKLKNKHYNIKNSPLYYHFSKTNTPVYLDQILQASNITRNRPIFIFNFNSSSSYLVINNYGLTYRSNVKIGQYQFWLLDLKHYTKRQLNDTSYKIYVFNHKLDNKTEPQLIPMRYIKEKAGNIEVFVDYYRDVEWFNQRQAKLGRVQQIRQPDTKEQWFKLELALLIFMLIVCLLIILCLCLRLCAKEVNVKNKYEMANQGSSIMG